MRKAHITIAILLCINYSLAAQSIKPATQANVEITRLLQLSKPDSNRIRLLYRSAELYTLKSGDVFPDNSIILDSAIMALKKTVALSDSLRLPLFINESRCRLGYAYLRKNDLSDGKRWVFKATSNYHLEGNTEKEADALIGMVGNMPKNISYSHFVDSILQVALLIYRECNRKEKISGTLQLSADNNLYMGNYNRHESELLEMLEIDKVLRKKDITFEYLGLSTLNRYKGNFDKSLFYSLQCLRQIEQAGDTTALKLIYGELALVYDGLGQLDESIRWYQRALKKREEVKEPTKYVYIHRTAGLLIQQMFKKNQAKQALRLIIELVRKYPSQIHETRYAIAQNFGSCYEALKQFDLAERYYIEMIEQIELCKTSLPYVEYRAIANQDIGRFYVKQRKYDKATFYLNRAIKTPVSANSIVRHRDIHLMLFYADSAAGKYLSAIRHFREYTILNDSIFNDKKSKQIEELQIQYQTEKKEKEIIQLNEQGKIQENKLQESALIRNFIILGILLLCGFVYYRYHLKQKSNKKLEAQQKEINQQNKTLQHLVNEKEWLLKEIHHRVKNNLQVIISLLESQSTYLENDIPALSAIKDSQHRVQAMSLIHKKLYQSDNVSTMNMLVYIHELVDYLRDSFHTEQRIFFDIHADTIELDISQAVPLGLIMNEAITNSIKYAFPAEYKATISIILTEAGSDNYLLEIADNGIGLSDTVNTTKPGSLGMSLMKGLSEEIDGSFEITCVKGTRIKIIFPINYHTNHFRSELSPAKTS